MNESISPIKNEKYDKKPTSELAFMNRMSPQARILTADFMLLCCAFLWGLGFVAMKGALDTYPTWWLLFLRFSGGSILMLCFFFKRIASVSKKDLSGGIIIGIFLCVAMGIQTIGLNYTSAGKQAFLTASYIIMVPFLVWGIRRVFPGYITLIASFVCFAGMGLLASDISGKPNIGDLFTVCAALFFAGHIIAIDRYATDGDPLTLTFVQFIVTAIVSGIIGLTTHGPLVFHGTKGLLEVSYAIVFCTFICFMTQNCAQKYTTPAHTSLIMGLESVFGLLSGIFILHDVFTGRMFFGCFLIFIAVVSVELLPLLRKSNAPSDPSLPPLQQPQVKEL